MRRSRYLLVLLLVFLVIVVAAPEAFELCNSLSSVSYSGTASQWAAIDIGNYNDPLIKAYGG